MITIYTRKDLRKEAELKSINEIEGYDFRFSLKPMADAEFVIFIDDDGQYHILKNRYDDDDPRTIELLKLIKI